MDMEQAEDSSIDKQSEVYSKLAELRAHEIPILPTTDIEKKVTRDNLKKAAIFLLKINLESLLLAVTITAIVVYKVRLPGSFNAASCCCDLCIDSMW